MPAEPEHLPSAAENALADFLGVPRENAPRQRLRSVKEIAPLIDALLAKYSIGRETPVQALRDRWREIAGSNAQYSHPAEIDVRNRLVVLTSHPVVRNELFQQKKLILARVRSAPGCASINALVFRNA
ncbi:MAG: DUF721 domain-containing protein [Opitutaceae bacterium]|jgi:hypothetical protein|nr:DUF721 domain-containing protein [Opitutaceae bacterium]